LALIAFALWLALAQRAPAVRVGAASVAALILFFAHLMACVVFGMLIAGYEIGEMWREREFSGRRIFTRAIAIGLPFVAPLALLLASPFGGELSGVAYEGILRKLGFLMFEGHVALDVAAVAALALLAAVGYSKRAVSVLPALRIPLLVLGLAFVLAPTRLTTAYGIEDRFPLAFVLLLAAGIVSPGLTTKGTRVAIAVGLAAFLARTAAFASDCERASQIYPRLIAILDQVPRGGRLAVAFDSNEIGPSGVPVNHLPTLAVLRRDAFVPTLFTYADQQPVTLTAAGWPLQAADDPGALWALAMAGDQGEDRLRAALVGFDALVVLGPRPFVVPPNRVLAPIGVEPNFALYRVVH
jgi:hypothetical protein